MRKNEGMWIGLRSAIALLGTGLGLVGTLAGCSRGAQVAPAEAPTVPVSQPVRARGHRLRGLHRPDRRRPVGRHPARVTGYLVKMPFKEGAEVKKGDLLFEIDPRPYQAQLDQATGQVNLYQAAAQARPGHLRPRPGHRRQGARGRQPAAARPGPRRRRGGQARVKAYEASTRGLQAQPRLHQGRRRPSTARSAATT